MGKTKQMKRNPIEPIGGLSDLHLEELKKKIKSQLASNSYFKNFFTESKMLKSDWNSKEKLINAYNEAVKKCNNATKKYNAEISSASSSSSSASEDSGKKKKKKVKPKNKKEEKPEPKNPTKRQKESESGSDPETKHPPKKKTKTKDEAYEQKIQDIEEELEEKKKEIAEWKEGRKKLVTDNMPEAPTGGVNSRNSPTGRTQMMNFFKMILQLKTGTDREGQFKNRLINSLKIEVIITKMAENPEKVPTIFEVEEFNRLYKTVISVDEFYKAYSQVRKKMLDKIDNDATHKENALKDRASLKKLEITSDADRKKLGEAFHTLKNKYEIKNLPINEDKYISMTGAKITVNETQMTLSIDIPTLKSIIWPWKDISENLIQIANVYNVKPSEKTVKAALRKEGSYEFIRTTKGAKSIPLGQMSISEVQAFYSARENLKGIYDGVDTKSFITNSLNLRKDILGRNKFVYEVGKGYDIGIYETKPIKVEKGKNPIFGRAGKSATSYEDYALKLNDGMNILITEIIKKKENPKSVWGDTNTDLTKATQEILKGDKKKQEQKDELSKLFTRGILKEAKRLTRFKQPKNEWLFFNEDILNTVVELVELAELGEFQRANNRGHILARLAMKMGGDSFDEVYVGNHPLFSGAKPQGVQAMRDLFDDSKSDPSTKAHRRNVLKLVVQLLLKRLDKLQKKGEGVYIKTDEIEEQLKDWRLQTLRKAIGDAVSSTLPLGPKPLFKTEGSELISPDEEEWDAMSKAYNSSKKSAIEIQEDPIDIDYESEAADLKLSDEELAIYIETRGLFNEEASKQKILNARKEEKQSKLRDDVNSYGDEDDDGVSFIADDGSNEEPLRQDDEGDDIFTLDTTEGTPHGSSTSLNDAVPN